MVNIINRIINRFHELFYLLRDMHNVVSHLDISKLKGNFDNNHVVIDDSIDSFVLKNSLYINNKQTGDVNRRLFVTTGGVSLLTAITLRKMSGTSSSEDYLLIETSTKHNATFLENNTNVAKLYDFKKIIFMQGQLNYNLLIQYDLAHIDEIYMVSHLKIYSNISMLYPNIKYTLFDEGPGSLFSYPAYNYEKIKKVIIHNYIGKFNYLIWHNTKVKPVIEFINEQMFRNILCDVRKKLNISINMDNNMKYILVCGPDILTKKHIKMNEILAIIDKLIKKGYKILFKKHPRDTDPYKFDDNIINIHTSYPMELYDLDIVAIVNFSSSICVTMPFYNKVAVFSDMRSTKCNKIDMPYMDAFGKFILKQYTVPLEILIAYKDTNCSPLILKEKFMKLFEEYISKIPEISSNQKVKKFIQMNKNKLLKSNLSL